MGKRKQYTKGRRENKNHFIPFSFFCAVAVNRVSICNDNVVDADEECDDGGNTDNDGCDSKCVLEDVEVVDINDITLDAYAEVNIDIHVLTDPATGLMYCCGTTLEVESVTSLSSDRTLGGDGSAGMLVNNGDSIEYQPPDAYNFPIGATVLTFDYVAKNQLDTTATKTVTITGTSHSCTASCFIIWCRYGHNQ